MCISARNWCTDIEITYISNMMYTVFHRYSFLVSTAQNASTCEAVLSTFTYVLLQTSEISVDIRHFFLIRSLSKVSTYFRTPVGTISNTISLLWNKAAHGLWHSAAGNKHIYSRPLFRRMIFSNKVGHNDLVVGLRLWFICMSVPARYQVPVYIGYNLFHPG